MSNSPSSAGSEEGDEDISALEYARLHGLSRNHLIDPLPADIIDALQENVDDGLIDDLHLGQLKLPPDYNMQERLTVSRDGAQMLAWVMHPESDETTNYIVCTMLGNPDLKHIRMELPLLSSDHESDVTKFANREIFETHLKEVRLPLEVLDIERNEGLDFPSTLWNLGAKTLEVLKREKISATKEGLQYIQNSTRPSWSDIDENEVWRGLQNYTRNIALETVTPLLSPILPLFEPHEPSMSDPAFQVPILSDPVSLTRFELSTLEANMLEQDIPTPLRNSSNDYYETPSNMYKEDGSISMTDAYCPVELVLTDSSSPILDIQPVKRDSLKVEGPLTPPIPPSLPKSVHFSDFVEEMLLDPSSSPPLDHTYFEKVFGDAAETTTQQIEQETLLAADAMGRIDVPVMDFSIPDPPWKISQGAKGPTNLLSIQKEILKNASGEGLPIWPGEKNDHTRLKWTPFLHDIAKNIMEEIHFDDDSKWEIFLKVTGDDQIIDTSSLTWKPRGLKILREDDYDEIEPGNFENKNPHNIMLVAKKRRRMFEVGGTDLLSQGPQSEEYALDVQSDQQTTQQKNNTPKSNALRLLDAPQGKKSYLDGFGLLMGGAFSAGNALDSFLEIRGIKKQKLTGSPHFSKNSKDDQDQIQIQTTRLKNLYETTTPLSDFGLVVHKVAPLPVPNSNFPTAPISLIVSSTIFKNRALIKYVQSQLPNLKLIERDFTAQNTLDWLPNSVTRSPVSSLLDSEADLIVSPSTGIVLTTLQKIKQKPLPGQKTKVPIRERLEKISVRYEKLVVLVSRWHVEKSCNSLDENDCSSFSEFVGFTSGLAATVLVYFVGGEENTLFKWLLSSIIQHAATESSLIEEETHWELFLRRAGMNAFAAQSISAAMKDSGGLDIPDVNETGKHGLATFVQMDKQERIEKFGDMCGKGLLERVSACLDARWQ